MADAGRVGISTNPANLNPPRIRFDQPHDHPQRCCLAGSVGTQQSVDLRVAHAKGNSIDGYERAASYTELLSEFIGDDHEEFG